MKLFDSLSFFLVLLLFPLSLSAAQFYVDNTATGASNGTNWANAWTNLLSVTALSPGDTVYISGGPSGGSQTYHETDVYVAVSSGVQGNPISYLVGQDSNHNGTVIFDGSSTPSGQFYFGSGGVLQHWLTFDGGSSGFVFTNYANDIFVVDDANGIVLRHARSYGSPFRGINSSSLELGYCMISVTNRDHCVFVNGTGTNHLIHHCTFTASRDPSGGFGDDCLQGPAANSEVFSNVFIGVPITNYTVGQHQDGIQTPSGNLRIHDNFFFNLGNAGISVGPYSAPFEQISNIWVYNNVIENCAHPLEIGNNNADSTWDAHGLLILNNTVSDGLIFNFRRLVGSGPYATNNFYADDLIANNVLLNITGIDIDPTMPTNANAIVTAANGTNYFTAYTAATDGWITTNSYDFHLTASGSTALASGTNLSSYFTTDKDARTRPAIAAWKIGSYEFPSAATYYVDFAGGSDGNNGTAKATPWQRHPYMKGATNSYSHSPGDQFIFKGGVTWPSNCFTLDITSGGSSGSRDYYGVDQSWYSGGSWTRPVFDAQSTPLGSTNANVMVKIEADYITVDNIEMTGFYWDASTTGYQLGYVDILNALYPSVLNCYFHNWTHDTYANGARDDLNVIFSYGAGSTTVVSNCVIAGTGESGCGIRSSGIVDHCTISNVTTAILYGGATNTIRYCELGPFVPGVSFDSGAHPNVIEEAPAAGTISTNWIHDNYIHDSHPSDTSYPVIFPGAATGGSSTNFVWNNVVWNVGRACIELDARGGPVELRAFNNTLVPPSGFYAILGSGQTNLSVLFATNNFAVSTVGLQNTFDAVATNNNIVETPSGAATDGFSLTNRWAPTLATAATVNAGVPTAYTTDILGVNRPQGAAWDVGAYEFITVPTPSLGPGVPPFGLLLMQLIRSNAPGALLSAYFSDLSKTQTITLRWTPTLLAASNWTNGGFFQLMPHL